MSNLPRVPLGSSAKGNSVPTLADGDNFYVASVLNGTTVKVLRYTPATGWQALPLVGVPFDTQAISLAAYNGRVMLTVIILNTDGTRDFASFDVAAASAPVATGGGGNNLELARQIVALAQQITE